MTFASGNSAELRSFQAVLISDVVPISCEGRFRGHILQYLSQEDPILGAYLMSG
jgi:hypothetical protein